MSAISGSVLFNVNNAAPTTGNAIANVPVVLRNTATGVGLAVLTDASGNFSFINVPSNRTYTLVEAWGTTIATVTTPGDFQTGTVIPAPLPTDPTVGAVPNPPATTNAVESLSPNTLILNLQGSLTNQNFIDGPVLNVPITMLDITPTGPNIITAAANGTWGTLPAASVVNTSPVTAPYPTAVPGFSYVRNTGTSTPADGEYTVTNINTLTQYGVFYNLADHTARDETGRFQIVGGSNSGSNIFTQSVSVTANTYLLMSLWGANMISTGGFVLPQLGVRLKNSSGTVLYNQIISNLTVAAIPSWKQTATLFYTGSNTSITLEIYSNGGSAAGNDYALDDISIQNVSIPTIITATKTVTPTNASIGTTLSYTTVLTNGGQSTVSNIRFLDTLPNGTTFVAGSVLINGTTLATLNPTPPGFTITLPANLASGVSMTINFKALVSTLPAANPMVNVSQATYDFFPIVGGATVTQTVLSNNALVYINTVTLVAKKLSNLAYVAIGETITYTILLSNLSTTIAKQVVLIDTIPNGTTLVPDSVIINGVTQTGANPSPPTGIFVGTIPNSSTTTVSFQVLVTTIPAPNPIPNSGYVTYQYTIGGTTISSNAVSNTVTTQVNTALVSSLKSTNIYTAVIGDTVVYTIVVANSGNITANSLMMIDTIPNGMTFIPNSVFINGVNQPGLNPSPPGGMSIGNLGIGTVETISFSVLATTIPF